ncbi:uncharacterized protein ASPGLDRAFT_388003 [Aspergillus glaucus CBS 516.65]|uniref:Secreted protein n=1 Tax=Aspergillus glaucus CBS 516.65 TaxID=1160497 RepID=A0A1L9VHI9_ASPGL|nr:hypothetical protein ASPGLDRAFT_388003 [Aspergillus glaucus CBS 516.65]OJJ83325.1 hypothetical protein ASPGLDRAFT_388003 [Aspergillus glaucus CBS 516.65]
MELAVFFLLLFSSPHPRLGHHLTRFAPCHFVSIFSVSIFSGAMDLLTCHVTYNLQRPLKDILALSHTQGCYFSGENGVISTFKRNIYRTQDVFSNFSFLSILKKRSSHSTNSWNF